MIERKIKVDREYTRDYEVLVRELGVKTFKIFGIRLFKDISDTNNSNKNTGPAKRPIGLRLNDEKSD